ncbi:MAG: nuclear transport factor 2 family protein [Cytophagales bacterium]|nr:MAG: nuclear transport factor 2 family protein [Cytophagales bacterium]TAF59500.1 MAG: nuclear transport factor 2 family protein [Cytophagales bacterium]
MFSVLHRTVLCLAFVALQGVFSFAHAQKAEKKALKSTIQDFFKAFHQSDTLRLSMLMDQQLAMQSILIQGENTRLSTGKRQDFLEAIAKLKGRSFEEKIESYKYKVNGAMANVYMSYQFVLDGQISHSGINNFTCFKTKDGWCIAHIIDTRVPNRR